jgi:hypothetical protein
MRLGDPLDRVDRPVADLIGSYQSAWPFAEGLAASAMRCGRFSLFHGL